MPAQQEAYLGQVEFNRPYAVVAVYGNPRAQSLWQGEPLFTGQLGG